MVEAVPIPKDLQPIIEQFVNTAEACDLFENPPFHDHWPEFLALLNSKLPRSMTEDEEQALYDDLRDYWANGNLIPDEQFPWSMGEWPWWIVEEEPDTSLPNQTTVHPDGRPTSEPE